MSKELEVVCNCLEEDGDFEFYTLNELQEKMEESVSKYYPNTRLKQKLEEKYGDHIFFFHLIFQNFGRLDAVCFKEFANYIVREMRKKQNVTEESIIQATAKIINLRSERFQNQISNIQQISKFKILRRLQNEYLNFSKCSRKC